MDKQEEVQVLAAKIKEKTAFHRQLAHLFAPTAPYTAMRYFTNAFLGELEVEYDTEILHEALKD